MKEQGRFYWRSLLFKTASSKHVSEDTFRKIMIEVGKAALGKQEAKAKEILDVLQASETEEEFLKSGILNGE